MKHLLLAFLLTFVSIAAQSQLTKHTWLVGGSGNFYTYHEDYTAPSVGFTGKYSTIDLSPSVGYFLADKFTVGIRSLLSIYKGESSGGAKPNDLKFAAGPFLRYYFLDIDKPFNLLTDISYQVGINEAKTGDKPKGKFNTFSAMAGTEIFFNSSVGLEILLGYKNQITSFDNSPSAYTSNKSGFYTSIGFHFHLIKD